jgi:uncharacterized protein (TIGR00304 family)
MLFEAGVAILVLGIFLLLLAAALYAGGRGGEGEAKGAAVLFIGPIPIAFGNDRGLLSISVLLALAMLVLLVLGWVMTT